MVCTILFIGDEGPNDTDSNWSMEYSTVVRVKTLHISSPILAAKSPFFYKVYFNDQMCACPQNSSFGDVHYR